MRGFWKDELEQRQAKLWAQRHVSRVAMPQAMDAQYLSQEVGRLGFRNEKPVCVRESELNAKRALHSNSLNRDLGKEP